MQIKSYNLLKHNLNYFKFLDRKPVPSQQTHAMQKKTFIEWTDNVMEQYEKRMYVLFNKADTT